MLERLANLTEIFCGLSQPLPGKYLDLPSIGVQFIEHWCYVVTATESVGITSSLNIVHHRVF
jgi:hypothetical protein